MPRAAKYTMRMSLCLISDTRFLMVTSFTPLRDASTLGCSRISFSIFVMMMDPSFYNLYCITNRQISLCR